MCNRVVQKDKIIKPGERVLVLLRGPGAEFSLPFGDAVFAGPAKSESRNYWIKREGAEPVLVPDITKFGEKNKTTGEQGWADLPAGSALQGLLLPVPPGKEYRLLKVVTQPATADQLVRLGNDRAPVVIPPSSPSPASSEKSAVQPQNLAEIQRAGDGLKALQQKIAESSKDQKTLSWEEFKSAIDEGRK